MPITRTPMIDDDGSGKTGTVVNNGWKQEFYDQIDAALLPLAPATGVWIDIPFNAATFSATGGSGGTWTVGAANIVNHSYMRIGKTVWFSFVASSLVVGGAPAVLQVALPAGWTCGRHMVSPFNLYDGQAGPGVGYLQIPAGSTVLQFMRDLVGTAWGAGAMHLHAGNIVFALGAGLLERIGDDTPDAPTGVVE